LLLPSLVVANEPAPLSPVWEPVPTRVEVNGDERIIYFGERQYRLSPAKANDRGEMRQPLKGAITQFHRYRKPANWGAGDFSIYAGKDGFRLVWLLPGFGLAVGSMLESGTPLLNLLRGQDGVLSPPVPGLYQYELEPLVFRSGADNSELLADRTLLIFGSHRNYNWSGMGAKATASPITQPPVAAAWLFDRQGVIQQWPSLKSLTPALSSQDLDRTARTQRYVRTSASGNVMFATAGKNGTLDIHVLSPELKPVRTISGVREFLQQTEQPIDKSKKRGAYGYWNSSFIDVAQIGGYPTEKKNVTAKSLTSVLLVPVPGMTDWYRVLGEDGSLSVPGDGIALKPLTRQRTADHYIEGIASVDYTLAYGYVVAYRVAGDIRYGWASPQLSTHTGPIWRNALVVDSERPDELRPTINVAPQLLLAQLDTGEWQAYAEPKVHIDFSTFLEPNTFSGYLPPASTPQQAAFLAEEVIIALGKEINKGNMAAQSSTLAAMSQQRQVDQQIRRQEQARKEAFWRMVMQGVSGGLQAAEVEPSSGGPQPSALGPDYYWQNGTLWHRPSGRSVR
jgi:hypothetical protein